MKLKGRLTGRPVLPALLLALLAFALTGIAQAEQPQQAPAQAPAATPPVPLLWKASAGDRAVYLLGSFHMLRADDYPLSPDVDAAFADSDRVMFEIPPEEL